MKSNFPIFRLPALISLSLICLSCSSVTVTGHHPIASNIVMVAGNGHLMVPIKSTCDSKTSHCELRFEETTDNALINQHFQTILSELSEQNQALTREECFHINSSQNPVPFSRKKRLMIFIHGGLNTKKGATERADRLASQIACEGFFPLFVIWESSLATAYLDHVLYIRQGEDWGVGGILFAPFYLAGDLTKGLIKTPFIWYSEIKKIKGIPYDLARIDEVEKRVARNTHGLQDTYEDQQTRATSIAIKPGQDHRGRWEETMTGALWAITLPFKWVTGPFISALGESTWDNLKRRTKMLFSDGEEFYKDSPKYQLGKGGLSTFLATLSAAVQEHSDEWEIVLIGHSMGTMVINEVLRRFDSLHFDSIVYMAAAASIEDYESSVFPYLRKHPRSHMYHLTLNNHADEREKNYWELTPRGSLLIWLDEFLTTPATFDGFAVGRYENLIMSIHSTPDIIRSQMSIREFDASNDGHPQIHGDFSEPFQFWRRECWFIEKGEVVPACLP